MSIVHVRFCHRGNCPLLQERSEDKTHEVFPVEFFYPAIAFGIQRLKQLSAMLIITLLGALFTGIFSSFVGR